MSRSLSDILGAVVDTDPHRVALVVDDRPTTYSELQRAARSCARVLHAAGVRPGHRVPVADDAGELGVAAVIGAGGIGAAAALMNPRLTAGELAAMLAAAQTTGPGVAGRAFAGTLQRAGCHPVLGADDLIDVAASGPDARSEPRSTDDAVVLFTSGTTGTPKAVPLDNELIGAKIGAYAPAVEPVAPVSLLSVPFVHVGGMLGTMVALARGSTIVVLAPFDAGEWLTAVERHRVSSSFVVPTMLHRILAHPAFDSTDLSSLTTLTYGAAPASPGLIATARAAFPGVALVNTFGQTETAGSIATLPPGDHSPERLKSVGRPLPGVEIRIVDPETETEVPMGGVGELWVKTDPKVCGASGLRQCRVAPDRRPGLGGRGGLPLPVGPSGRHDQPWRREDLAHGDRGRSPGAPCSARRRRVRR